jgi:alkanesulfonate monooxygenase SsuD/methylene tetrahydromethanopterin reductase-like flavin-dependent oxidoreductase (luciferase family)
LKVKFGCQLPQESNDFKYSVRVAKECEKLGYDSVWAHDHLSPFWIRSGRSLECWTVLAGIAERTSKIRIGSLVTNVNLRNPALLAKMSSTIDNISGGRLILGLGTADSLSRRELLSNGFRFPSLEERIGRMRETILILKSMWSEDNSFFQGRYYTLTEAVNYPKPRQKPHPPLWIGGKHPKILDLVAEMANGWNYWRLSKKELKQRNKYLSLRCDEFNRPRNEIVKSWSGTLQPIPQRVENPTKMLLGIIHQLRNETDAETAYFIASFGARAPSNSYEIFADAVRSL